MAVPKIKPQLVYDGEGNIQSVLLSEKDFEKFVESIEDYYDYHTIKEMGLIDRKDTVSLEEIEKELFPKKR